MSWLENLFFRAGKTLLRMRPERLLAAGTFETLPTAAEEFLGAFGLDAEGAKVCREDGAGGYEWALIRSGNDPSWSVLTDGDPTDPQLIFTDGDVIMTRTEG